MKMKTAGLLLALFAVVAFAFAAPPVYPGAKAVDELNKAAKIAGQDTMTYNTADPFERVYEFYKSKVRTSNGRTGQVHGKNLPWSGSRNQATPSR